MWGSRVVVPAKLRERVLATLHEGHIGMVKMKGLSRGFVWWPNIDKDIEGAVRSCEGCQELANNPARASLHRWEYPSLPWQRLHIDFAGPVQGKMLMVVIDAHSKWPEIFVMENTTAEETISTLRSLFARMGLPDQIVSDNGPQFTSETFRKFATTNGISMSLVPPTTHRPMVRQKDWYRVSRKELRLTSPVEPCNTCLIGFCSPIDQHHMQLLSLALHSFSWVETSRQGWT